MSVRQQWDGICERLAQRYRGILARSTTADGVADTGETERARRWKPRPGQGVLVVTVCGTAAHHGLGADVIGCRGRVSGVEHGDDHPYEVLVTLSERVYLYGRFAVGELAPLSGMAARSDEGRGHDRSSPPGCRPQAAVSLAAHRFVAHIMAVIPVTERQSPALDL